MFVYLCNSAIAQDITNISDSITPSQKIVGIPDSLEMSLYSDSLKKIFQHDLLTGYTISVFNESVADLKLIIAISPQQQLVIQPDRFGRFFILPDSSFPETIIISAKSEVYQPFDTSLTWKNNLQAPVCLTLTPRYMLYLRGRVFSGSLPLPDATVEIIHINDTILTQTLDCYNDNENYWNCLYLGMFRQTIAFDNPQDSVFICIWKEGYQKRMLQFKCNEYTGDILPVKMKFSRLLPRYYQNNISLKLSPPFFHNWMVALNYFHLFKLNNFNRLGVGLESSMLVSDITTTHNTFLNPANLPDTGYFTTNADSSYISTMISPQVYFYISNPQKRYFSFYTGVSFPYIFNEGKFYIHPFIASSWFLDLNKALLVELRYAAYSFDVANFTFNPYGNAYRFEVKESFRKLILSVGLQICF
jgi:hypothetical protein